MSTLNCDKHMPIEVLRVHSFSSFNYQQLFIIYGRLSVLLAYPIFQDGWWLATTSISSTLASSSSLSPLVAIFIIIINIYILYKSAINKTTDRLFKKYGRRTSRATSFWHLKNAHNISGSVVVLAVRPSSTNCN